MSPVTLDIEQALANAGLVPVCDEARGAAYAAMPVDKRGVIKFTLSLVEGIYGRTSGRIEAALRPDYGIGHSVKRTPAHWTLCLIGQNFASAPRLAAALMLARLSDQEHIVAIWQGEESTFPPDLLTVLELTGIDLVFAASKALSDRVPALLQDAFGSEGRTLLFGSGVDPLSNCPAWRDRSPRLALASANPDAEAILRWAHPDADWSVSNDPGLTVLYGAEGTGSGCLCFGVGLEGCWLPPDLNADFFMQTRHTVRICQELAEL